jgi:DNA-binding FrmR family transcriptional regulator
MKMSSGAFKKIRLAEKMPDDLRSNLRRRLRRAEGQIRGVQKMVDGQRYCPDVLNQIAAIHESLRAVERLLLANHLQHCATTALRSGDEEKAEQTYKELTELFYRHAR